MELLEKMQNSPYSGMNDGLTSKTKHEVFEGVLSALNKKFYKPELLGNGWHEAVTNHRATIEGAPTLEAFEQAVTALLQNLKTSHVGFFHQSARRASSRAALSATYLSDETAHGPRWIFQDVHDGGAAALAGIQPGDILLRLDDQEIIPPEHPVFPMGATSKLNIVASDDRERTITVNVSKPKGKKLQFVEPTLVQSKIVANGVGYRTFTIARRWKGDVFEEPIPEPLTLPPRLDREDDLLTRRTSRSRFLAVPVTRRGDVFVGRIRPGRSLVERPRSSLVFPRFGTGGGMSDFRPHPTK
jgi:C-terminal processing protease CtpA/Prc